MHNAPAHSARNTRAELQNRGLNVMEWPPYSPDLNPIEMVWSKMKDHVAEMTTSNTQLNDLRDAVIATCDG